MIYIQQYSLEKTKRTLPYWTHCVMPNLWTFRLVWTLLHLKSVIIRPTYWKFFNWLKFSQLSLGHISLSKMTTELPYNTAGAMTGRLWRRTAVAIYAITSSINDQWIAGTTWHKKKWMRLQLIRSKTTWRNVGDGRWTSLWTTTGPLVLWLHDFRRQWWTVYLAKMRRLGAAAPGELPGEFKTFVSPDNSEALYVYNVFHKKTTRYLVAHNFGKCWPIFKIFPLSDSAVIV